MRLNMPRLHGRSTPESASLTFEQEWDPAGTVRFETAWARRRFIPIEPMGDAIHFVTTRRRHWPGQHDAAIPQLVTRGGLPDT